jgi:diguanylate cyclase (GGDEF)-like protein
VQNLHFAVRKDWPELTSIIQKGLDSISPRQRKIISEKWLSLKFEKAVNYSLVWSIVLGFSLLLLAILLSNWLLKRKVQLRTSQLAYSTNYDQLTDLPNRHLILERLTRHINEARSNNNKVALFSIDIDDFKKINDAFGHQAGDAILKEFAIRLKTSMPNSENIARLGGNQFLVIQTQCSATSDSARIAERIIACARQRFNSSHQAVSLSVSLGISLFPDDGDTAELLLKHADTATHYAKEQMQGCYAFYTENLIRKVARRLELERHIHDALKRNEFEVYYQPKVQPATRRIVCFEALLRWKNDTLGWVSPAEFIPITEKNGLIQEIGLFVLQEALATLASWQQRFHTNFSMAINLSPAQFRSNTLIPAIRSFLFQNSLDSKSVEFEITEGVLMDENTNIEGRLSKLKSLGVSLAMDDFGKGYSSLSYLRKYKFNTLKIDREFIAELAAEEDDRKLVSAIIAMAHELGLTVVAEGVETEQQYSILVEHNCDLLQGWLFCKAKSSSEITAMLDSQFEQCANNNAGFRMADKL